MTKTDLLEYFVRVSNGQKVEHPKVKTYCAKSVRISANQELPANSDKDLLPGKRLLEIKIIPKALSVIVGKGIGLTIPVESVPAGPPLSGPQQENSSEGFIEEKIVTPT